VAVAAVVAVAWSPVIWRLTNGAPHSFVLGIDDYPRHVFVAERFRLHPLRVEAPHFLFSLGTWAWKPLFGAKAAPVITLSIAVAIAVVGVWYLLGRPRPDGGRLGSRACALLALGYFFSETPALVLHELHLAPATAPYQTIHWWGNPTWLMGLPFLILLLPLVDRLITEAEAGDPASSRTIRGLVLAVVLLGTAAKPTLILVMVPALPAYLVLSRRATWRTLFAAGLWVEVPAILLLLWQTWFLGTSQSVEFRSGVTFAPIVSPPFGWHRVGVVFLLPFAVVITAALLTRGRFFREPSVPLLLCCTAVALPLMLCIRETGAKAKDGNMAIPMQACTTMLVLLALRSVAWVLQGWWIEFRTTSPSRARVAAAVAIAFGALLFLAGGALSYLDATRLLDVPTDWQVIR
jgi:hypothetical protein